MGSLLNNLLAVLFAFMLYELPVALTENFDEIKGSEYTAIDLVRIDPLGQSMTEKSGTKINPIAQGFIPLVVIAPTVYEVRDFTYYLPLFAHSRIKDFFLLI